MSAVVRLKGLVKVPLFCQFNKDRANTVLKMNALYFIAHIFCLTHAFPLPDASKKITQLSETIHKKDVEMQGMEERYKKYIEKVI